MICLIEMTDIDYLMGIEQASLGIEQAIFSDILNKFELKISRNTFRLGFDKSGLFMH